MLNRPKCKASTPTELIFHSHNNPGWLQIKEGRSAPCSFSGIHADSCSVNLYHASKVILGIAIPVGQNRERTEEQTWKIMASPNGPTPYHIHSHPIGMNSAT